MVRVLKRTIVLDISGFPAMLSCYDVAKAIDDRFSATFTVKLVQFLCPASVYKLHLMALRPKLKLNSSSMSPSVALHVVLLGVVHEYSISSCTTILLRSTMLLCW